MARTRLHAWLVAIALTCLAALAHAQAPPAAETAKPPATDATPAAPSAETLKKARSLGLHPESRRGATVYCWEEAAIGSRFKDKHCVPESQLDELVAKREAVQQQFHQGNCGATGCGK